MRRGFVVTEDEERGKRRVPVLAPIIIGRAVDCDISIDDAAASRHHVEIQADGDTFSWKDLGSTNGTLLNGVQMLEGEFKDGDEVQIGETVLRFEIEEIPEAPSGAESTLFKTLINAEGKSIQPTAESAKAEGLLRAVYALMNQIASNYEPCSLVDQILETTLQAIQAHRGTMLFAGPDGEELLPCPECGKFHIVQNGRLRHVARENVEISNTVAHRVLSRGESVLYQDAQSDGDISNAQSILALNLRSIMCVPVRGKYGILGLLYVDTTQQDKSYSHEDMLLATAVGNSAGLALENARLHKQIVEKERMDQEIQHAWSIQEGFLAHDWEQEDDRFSVFGDTRPAKVVGGDFYDFLKIDQDTVGILVGDVSGKGVPAALTMAQMLTEFRVIARKIDAPAEVLARLNESLAARSRYGMFCTVCYLKVDVSTGKVRCANAGHLSALLVNPTDAEEFGAATGPPLGIIEETPWEDTEASVSPGDTILLYTDGIVEARGMHTRRDTARTSDEFGVRNVSRVAKVFAGGTPNEMVSGIIMSVQEYTAPASPHDDCTLVALRYEGS